MVKISLPQNQFFDDAGAPLASGYVSIFLHGSDNLAPVYTLDGDIYREAANPMPCSHDGRIPTLFFDAAIVDVLVEDRNFAEVDTYQAGFEWPAEKNDTVVQGIAALKETDPSVGVVTVVGYDQYCEAPPRTYVWDKDSQDTPDDGIVVEGPQGSTGNWILVWCGRELPVTIYGVVPGHEANLSAALGYQSSVGSFGLRTPSVVRFPAGTYSTSSTLSTTKVLSFDRGAKFTAAEFVCPCVEIAGNDGYVADFTFTGSCAQAHSSWFRSVTAFWFSGAKKFIIDNVNYFADSVVHGSPTIENAVIEGSKRMAVTYDSGRYLAITRCAFAAKEIFSPSADFIRFAGMGWHDEIWNDTQPSHYDFGKVTNGHSIEFLSSGVNNMELSQFSNTMVYVRMREANIANVNGASTVLDMQGRTLANFNSSAFIELKECHVTGNITLTSAPSGFRLTDVKCDGNVNGGTNPVVVGCRLTWATEWTGSIEARDSWISGGNLTGSHDISMVGGYWGMNLRDATDNTADTGTKMFTNVEFSKYLGSHKTKNLYLQGCNINGQTFEIYPMYNSTAGKFIFQGRMEGCMVFGTNPVAYKIFHGLGDGCKDCLLAYAWVGNSFVGNAKGLTFEFWADTSVLAEVLALSGHDVTYSGNGGNCPLEAWHGSETNITWLPCAFYAKDGDIDAPSGNYFRANLSIRAVPNFKGAVSQIGTYGKWTGPAYQIQGGTTTKGYLAATNPAPVQYGYGDVFDSVVVRYGSAGDNTVTFV